MTKRVLLITDVTQPGGVNHYLLHLCKGALRRNLDVMVLLDEHPGSNGLFDQLKSNNINVRRGPLYHRNYDETVREKATQSVLDQFAPDLVHVVCPAPWATLVPREVVIKNGVPLVFTEQYVADDFTFNPGTIKRIGILYKKAFRVIAVSRANEKLLTNLYGLPSGRLQVIFNGIDTKVPFEFSNSEKLRTRKLLRLPNTPIHCATIARLTKQKGIDILIRASALLDKTEIAKFTFSIFGDGPDKPALEDLARQLGVLDRVVFFGWTENAKGLLPAFDLFVLPSRSEGQPFALLEALAAGRPVIATDIPGITEVLEVGPCGMMISPEDPHALAEAIRSFLTAPDSFAAMAKRARANMTRRHDIIKNIDETTDIWFEEERTGE